MDFIFSNRLYDIRSERKISQAQMSKDLGISRRSISRIENGEQNLSLEMAYRLAAYFKLSVEDVFPVNEEKVYASVQISSEKMWKHFNSGYLISKIKVVCMTGRKRPIIPVQVGTSWIDLIPNAIINHFFMFHLICIIFFFLK